MSNPAGLYLSYIKTPTGAEKTLLNNGRIKFLFTAGKYFLDTMPATHWGSTKPCTVGLYEFTNISMLDLSLLQEVIDEAVSRYTIVRKSEK
jgi:hypothetical protein